MRTSPSLRPPFLIPSIAGCLAAALGSPVARADLHVEEAVSTRHAIVLVSRAREVHVGRPGEALRRMGRLPERASPLATDDIRVVSVARHEGKLRRCELSVDLFTSIFGCQDEDIPAEADARALDDLVVPDVSGVFLGGGWRWDRETGQILPGHLPGHPDLEVIASKIHGDQVIRLCRDSVASEEESRALWLVSGLGLRVRVGVAAQPPQVDRLELDDSAAHVLHGDGRVVAWAVPSLMIHEDLSPMLPGGELRALSIDADSYWLETVEEDGVAHWRVDRETLDHERVSLAGVPRGYRVVGDTGADLWFARPGRTEDVVLLSVPKNGAGAQGYGARSRGERRTSGFFRRVGRGFRAVGTIVALPVLLPIWLFTSAGWD